MLCLKVTATWGTALRSHSIRKVEGHWSEGFSVNQWLCSVDGLTGRPVRPKHITVKKSMTRSSKAYGDLGTMKEPGMNYRIIWCSLNWTFHLHSSLSDSVSCWGLKTTIELGDDDPKKAEWANPNSNPNSVSPDLRPPHCPCACPGWSVISEFINSLLQWLLKISPMAGMIEHICEPGT